MRPIHHCNSSFSAARGLSGTQPLLTAGAPPTVTESGQDEILKFAASVYRLCLDSTPFQVFLAKLFCECPVLLF